jgi:hypothetical protein
MQTDHPWARSTPRHSIESANGESATPPAMSVVADHTSVLNLNSELSAEIRGSVSIQTRRPDIVAHTLLNPLKTKKSPRRDQKAIPDRYG